MSVSSKIKKVGIISVIGITLIGSGTFASQALKTIDSLRSSLTNTETKVQNYVDNVTQRMSELNGQIQSLTETKLSLESQITTLTSERDDLQTQLNNANGTNTELQNQIEGLNTQISNLQTELGNAQTEYEKLQGEYDALVLENGNVENHYSNMVDSANELGQIHESNVDAILEGGAVEDLPESDVTTPDTPEVNSKLEELESSVSQTITKDDLKTATKSITASKTGDTMITKVIDEEGNTFYVETLCGVSTTSATIYDSNGQVVETVEALTPLRMNHNSSDGLFIMDGNAQKVYFF